MKQGDQQQLIDLGMGKVEPGLFKAVSGYSVRIGGKGGVVTWDAERAFVLLSQLRDEVNGNG